MKKSRFVLILLTAVLAVCTLAPGSALAADSDFDVSFEVFPGEVGYNGGNVQLTIRVDNNGATNITWLDVVVNTTAPYSQRWTGTIAPGSYRTLAFNVPFQWSDLGVSRILQVSMNNNTTANPDGVKMMNFQVGKITDIFDTTCTISPARSVYRPGETVTVGLTFTNNVETHAALNVRSTISMSRNFSRIYEGTQVNHGNVFPGQTVTTSFRYTFDEDDAGEVMVSRLLEFTLMDALYVESKSAKVFDVKAPSPEFSASLYAEPTSVAAGEDVKFRIAIGNTGGYAVDRFEVTDLGGATVAEAEGLPAGGSGSVTLDVPVYETGDYSYVVVGTTGTTSVSLETNSVHITVEQAAEAESAASASPAGTGGTAPASASPPSSSSSSTQPATAGTVPADQPAAAGEAAAAAETDGAAFPWLLIWIIIAAAAAAVILLVAFRKRGEK